MDGLQMSHIVRLLTDIADALQRIARALEQAER